MSERAKHPSYAMMGISRVHGGSGRFFGSPLKRHGHHIQITICEAEREHHLSSDNFYGHNEIIRLRMTASQFSDMITSLNIGYGVPCTLIHVQGNYKPEPPDEDPLEVERIQAGYEKKLAKLVDRLSEMEGEVAAILERPNLRKADKEKLRGIFGAYRRHLTDNAPFTLRQFQEASERVVDVAKREVVEFVTATIQRTGLEALSRQKDALTALPEAKLTEEDRDG